MNRTFVNILLLLMLIALLIMATTALLFVFNVSSQFALGLHKITGLVFMSLIIIHIITFRKIAYNFLFGSQR